MLNIKNLHTFYGLAHILQGVDMSIGAGTIGVLLGRNGVGKSTTIRSIIGLAESREGSITLFDQELAGLKPHLIAQKGVAYVPEGRLIFPDLTVLENIQVAQHSKDTPWPILRLFELFPSLKARETNKGSQLSGGEQQMLAIARALVINPKLILLDEPSQGLAPLVVKEVAKIISILKDTGVTIFLVEQNLKLATAVADHVFVMVKGKVVYDNPVNVFLREEEAVKKKYLTL
jgi:branched-chain amino acid transport system ATP-binding protein